jgi:TATA-box binding protein (TBP) (component of TFIID and TFIIIB)
MQIIKNHLPKELKICNIVTTADLKQKIDIEKLNEFPWGIYDQVSYNGICGYIKNADMKGKVVIFNSGKMISVGSNNIEDSTNKLNQAKFNLVQENLIKNITLRPIVRNIVAVISLNKTINLKKLKKKIPNSVYEPEVFAGLRYKIKEGLSTLIFSSGKIVIAGGKSVQDILDVYLKMKKLITN